jgi:hypothetical protein
MDDPPSLAKAHILILSRAAHFFLFATRSSWRPLFCLPGFDRFTAHKTGDIKSRVSSWVPSSTPISDSHKPSGQNACKVDYPVFPAAIGRGDH